MIGSITAIKARAPVLGGNFGIWGGMFSSFDCAVKGYRQKEDPWNAIISGFLTGGSLAIRGECSPSGPHRGPCPHVLMSNDSSTYTRPRTQIRLGTTLTSHLAGGPKAALSGAVGCGILLGVFEGEF
jgi:hypothetical protein